MCAAAEGFRLGVLMLETRFARPPGDVGNPVTFPFETLYEVIPSASVARVVTADGLAPDLLAAFIDGGRRLVERGADLIATSCGFLYRHQTELARALPRPIVTSALCLLPLLRTAHAGGRPIGILTFDARALTRMLAGDGGDLVIEGIPRSGELYRAIIEDRLSFDRDRAQRDCVAAAHALMRRRAGMCALVLECTNLPPYRTAIADACGCPVYDIRDLVHLHARAKARE